MLSLNSSTVRYFTYDAGSLESEISLISCPKLGEEQKINKRSSLKFRPILCPKLGEELKTQEKGLHSNLV